MSAASADRLVLTPQEVADMLGISLRSVFRHAAEQGHVFGCPALRSGRMIRFSRVQIEALLAGPVPPSAGHDSAGIIV